ncbi:phosphonate metabolism protein/1,5-bisphosphokinase (PRPP-forming) PhnN [Piscinibacter sp. HJYY11]|uniref:phosphonate metabolism protein/1,5-bisphosphokinase (PRPP-forming) PhnN n=1 Tax=Piscinibacter sp. HJYY11 TaxID=2801333 RepID=UPI00191E316E|nr:phosphonate metabolism protein/1,5-bisphosphokinase (PRPP-forming) PhnN [Piscinibacter sp. HJYY11]MBL0728870.1 phosphonate metabolism protein/1,5-bisphosphokinase (PRPP-forming) PhnN [Piscinibacter sp. HJYY11]
MRHHDLAQHLHTHSQHLLVVVGRSGVGKDAVIGAWLRRFPAGARPHLAQRVITRERHSSEDHEPVTVADFLGMAAGGYFGFRWQAHGLHYGVRWSELAPLREGRCVVLNGSRQHLPQLREVAPQARVVEIVLPDALRAARLHGRGRETPAELGSRLSRTAPDSGADLVIDNSGPLDDTVAGLHAWWSASALAPLAPRTRQPAQP